jgi:hypothetical protein
MVTVQAADIAPVIAHLTKLGKHSSAFVYYIDDPDGLHVVVTTQQRVSEKVTIARFETVLTAGQSAAVSIPRAAGEAPAQIVLRETLNKAGGRLDQGDFAGAVRMAG